ncbi:hypothetical protein [Domibacillus indicus]|uniref:hypothetical protein n=1 Tax=Domibacillus indicus TaxID=1437523 RepID=UPI000617AE85|nr:hypothetical protein [Domibacillus indicus]
MFVNKDLKIVEPDNETVLNEFFIFPMCRIDYSNGLLEKETGMRICLIRAVKKKYEFFLLDITKSALEEAEWLSAKSIKEFFGITTDNSFAKSYNRYLIAFNEFATTQLKDESRVIYTDQIGWIKGGEGWSYVPVITPSEKHIVYDQNIKSKYKIKVDKFMELKEAFQVVLSMLDIADKKVTIPLLSYSILSLFTSLINYNKSGINKFLICISGDNSVLRRAGFANLFCNLYDRKQNLNSINAAFHSNLSCTEEELRSRSSKIRDGIFIVNTEKNNRKIQMSRKLLQNDHLENMTLLLSEDNLDQDFVLNVNIDNIQVNTILLEKLKSNPESLTTGLSYFVRIIEEAFNDIGERENVRKEFVRLYKAGYATFNDKGIEYDINKIHMSSLLLVGFKLFLDCAEEVEAINAGLKEQYYNEAQRILKAESIVANSLESNSVKSSIEKHDVFLSNLLNLLQVNKLIDYKDKNNPAIDHTKNLGWIENENVLYIKADIFGKIEDLLKTSGQEKHLSSKDKRQIYQELYKHQVILKPDDGKEIEKVQVTTIEKVLNVANSSVKIFKIDYQRAKEYIKEKR